MCKNGQCVPKYWFCDGHVDCIDGSDEENCVQICNEYEHTCDDGLCVPKTFICDGQKDCAGGEDEKNCKGYFIFILKSSEYHKI